MRAYLSLFLFCLSAPTLFAQKPITVEDIWQNDSFQLKTVPGFEYQRDGRHYTQSDGRRIESFDLLTGASAGVVLDAASLKTDAAGWNGTFDSYVFSADESKVLLATNTVKIFRRSTEAQYYVADLQKGTLEAIYPPAKQRNAAFSPDGTRIAFVSGNNLMVYDINTRQVTQVTNDGKKGAVINGASDWVYEEEFALVTAFAWSPDSKHLAWLRFDESEVHPFIMETYTGGAYPGADTLKYPKVGEKNASVSAWICDLGAGTSTRVQAEGEYIPRIQWTPAGALCITLLNRHQDELRLLLADAASGVCSSLLTEKSRYYHDLEEPYFLRDGSGFIWPSEKSGFRHLYLYDMAGNETVALTKGKFDVTEFYGVDAVNNTVFYQAAAVQPMQREIYSVSLKGKGTKTVISEPGFNGAQFAPGYTYFLRTYSNANTPPQYALCDRKGKTLRVLEPNQRVRSKQQEYGVQPVTFFEVPIANAEAPEGPWTGTLNGWMIKPADSLVQGRKLPVLMFVYGGPGSQQVLDQWRGNNYWWFQMLAQQGFMVVCVDNRGTGARGEYFQKMTYLQLGKYETADQIAAAKYLGTLPYVDPERIGIFGWSYGGYMSSLCLLKGNDVFRSAIAVAPVTHWKWYDDVYTERYMRTYEENPSGYDENAPVNFAKKLKGDYLLVHGLGDDNVHFQHAAEMANRLIAADKQFDSMIYPNRNHSIPDKAARTHLYRMMTSFLEETLGAPTEIKRP